MRVDELKQLAAELRAQVVSQSHRARCPHLGSALSCIDILVTAYFDVLRFDPDAMDSPDRDRFILSKGHAASALYAVLARRGVIDAGWLDRFNTDGAELAEHPPVGVAGVEAATGSLGHGLPIGLGQALGAKIQGRDSRVYVTLSDGECNEGSVWEAAMVAPAKGLANLMVIVDFNRWQATGRSEEVTALQSLKDKWQAFGWHAVDVDGHDIETLRDHMHRLPHASDKPVALIAHTVKGKGVSFMEDDNNWHYRIPTEDEVATAHHQLLGRSAASPAMSPPTRVVPPLSV